MTAVRLVLAFMVSVIFAGAAAAQAPLRVDVTSGHLDPLPIAVVDFVGEPGLAGEAGADIARVVTSDLESTGLFAPVSQDAFIEEIGNIDLRPRFSDWRVINANALLVGRVTVAEDGRLLVAFRLWDTVTETQLLGLQFVSVPENWRRVAHKVADAVYEELTGEEGYFDTRIVYVAEGTDGDGQSVRRLAIMDQDGANPSFLTDRSYMALLPNFSPSAQQITYVSFRDGQATSYLYDLETGRQEALFDAGPSLAEGGQSLSARFHPNGRQLAVSAMRRGGHDIFGFDLRMRTLRQLTSHPADDVEPSYSPEGDRIVFSSSRGGSSQLYVMDANGGEPTRISFGGGRYTAPVWSPRGDLVAFVKQQGGMFALGVLDADGSGEERILYEGYYVDTPTWSPNGRVILFTRGERSREGTQYSIWSIDLAGINLRRMPIQGQSSDPAWSPLID
ncbi:protein TolB [Marinicauda pacifica]|jgi:TolB protein|uniref:Tol-Pal system protein TolB n=1 Tax=Marinicauda pacifica TaxID=1133559 RepID=A0A4S2H909_9PROT|nr:MULTISPECIES: Tol-Pal system beta propeller repeat protein TolB [Marinicauda]TGY92173.1 Tol-Pal system protein TolB [Marinicauda pacifica]GGE46562.1 protein TolB [Marinicauda pacifica]